jgi:rhamnosyltransferase
LFIDSVDHEYCLRLRKEGYDVIRLNTAVLYHSLGNISYHKVFGLLLKTTNHSAARRYYITRNRLFVMTRYAGFDFRFFLRELSELIKSFWIILFVENNKSEKINAMFRGTWHFVTGRYGKI